MRDFAPIHFDVLHLKLFFIILLPQGYHPLGGHRIIIQSF